jgi:hypothetical protein
VHLLFEVENIFTAAANDFHPECSEGTTRQFTIATGKKFLKSITLALVGMVLTKIANKVWEAIFTNTVIALLASHNKC